MKPFSSPASRTASNVPNVNKPRSKFNRSKNYKTSFNTSLVYPIYKELVIPGDTVDMNMHNFVRMNPTVAPFMDNIYIDTHFFFVPMRLVWDNWQKFMGERKSPADSIDYLIPTITTPVGGWNEASPACYLGMRGSIAGHVHSSLPLRSYNLVYNEWFRDQNLQTPLPVDTDDGPDTPTDYSVLGQRNKTQDYFTTMFTAPQKGPSVLIPTSDSVTVERISNGPAGIFRNAGANTVTINGTLSIPASDGKVTTLGGTDFASYDPNGSLIADLTENTEATINALRTAEAIQSLLETDARGGTRYIEMMRAHFGVISQDARLQRPEYLGGNSIPLSMLPVVQNSETATTPQGNLAGMGVMNSHNARFLKSFTEHGYIIGVMSARSDISYQQGADRDWYYSTRYDFYLPELANLGEQAVLNQELFIQGTSADTEVAGYQERWREMREGISRVTGSLNSDAAASLDFWHLAQDFAALPVLNSTFIKDGTPELRVLEVTNESAFVADIHFEQYWTRVMPMFSIPQMGTRF